MLIFKLTLNMEEAEGTLVLLYHVVGYARSGFLAWCSHNAG
jgi:hypothetical protein